MPLPFNYKLYFQEDEDDSGGDREYWDSGLGAAGCIFLAKDTGRILLAHRSGRVEEPGTWGTWGGKIDEGETPKDAVVREIEEETGYDGDYRLHLIWTFEDRSKGFQYHNYLVIVPNEFTPQLNWESSDSEWVEYGEWPTPMHFGLKALIRNAGEKLHRVVTLIKRRNAGVLESTGIPKRRMKRGKIPVVIREMIESQNPNSAVIFKKGIVGDGVWEYELRSPKSYIRYRYSPGTKTFYLDNIGTPVQQDQNKGYAKALLETFFRLIRGYGGALDTESYTTSGMAKIKHVVERFAKQYGVRLVKGQIDEVTIHGREFPMTVYHGGSMTAKKPVIFVTRHKEVAQSYAKDRKGKVHAFMLDIKRPAGNKEVDAVAEKLGIGGSIGKDSPSYEYLSPDMVGYDKVKSMVSELSKQGFDSAWIDGDFSMEDSFTEYDSFVVWNQSVLKPVTALTEETLRTLHGSVIARHKNNVGKRVGNQIYVHRDYAPEVIPQAVLQRAQQVLDKAYPGFAYNCMVYDAVKGIVRFDESPDFNSAREPHVGDFVTIFPDGTLPPVKGHSNSIWHHKWLWVKDDYKGFDVDKSKEWSKLWLSKLEGPAKGTDATWKMQLRNVDLLTEEFKDWNGEYWVHYSNVDYLKINPTPECEGDIRGVYLFPSQYSLTTRTLGHFFAKKKYKLIVKITRGLNILDLISLSLKDCAKIMVALGHKDKIRMLVDRRWVGGQYEDENHPVNIKLQKSLTLGNVFFRVLKRFVFENNGKEFSSAFQKLGYDGIFGDNQTIMADEIQLIIFNDANVEVVKVVPNDLQHKRDMHKSAVDESQDDGVYLGALDSGGSNMQPVYSDDQLTNHPSHMKATDRRWRYYPDLKQLDWQGQPTPEEHEGTKEFLAQRGMPVVRVHYLAGSTKKENMLLMEAKRATPRQLEEFLREQIKGTEWDGKVFAVGGFVRDLLLGKEPKDLDIVIGVNQGGSLFTKWLGQKLGIYKEGSNPVIFPTFGTANLRLDGVIWKGIDFTGEAIDAVMFRKEQYHDPNTRKPTVQFTPYIEEDAKRRDITFNALYLDIASGKILDPTGKGKSDLDAGIVRTAIDPTIIYTDDALRMFRAVRFAAQLGFKLDPSIIDGIKKNLHRLSNTSRERVRDELNKILVSKHPNYGMQLLRDTGLLPHVGPEFQQMVGMTQNVHHKDDVFDHTLAVIMGTKPEVLNRLIALFHDIGKVTTRAVTPKGVQFIGHEEAGPDIVERVMMSLKYPRVMIDAVKLGVRHHMKLKQGGPDAVKLSDKTLRKFKIALGQYLDQLLDVMHADNISHADASAMPKQIEAVRARLKALDIQVTKPVLPINGNDLLAIGVKAGPMVGKILNAVTEKWYENPNVSKEEAMHIARSILNGSS